MALSVAPTRVGPEITGAAVLVSAPAAAAAVRVDVTPAVGYAALVAVARTVIRLPSWAGASWRLWPVAPAIATPFARHW